MAGRGVAHYGHEQVFAGVQSVFLQAANTATGVMNGISRCWKFAAGLYVAASARQRPAKQGVKPE